MGSIANESDLPVMGIFWRPHRLVTLWPELNVTLFLLAELQGMEWIWGGKGGIMAIISSFLFFALRSLEIKRTSGKNPEKKCFPTSVCMRQLLLTEVKIGRFPRQQDLGRFLSQTLNTHCMTLVKWGTPAFLNLLLLLSSIFKIACDCTHFGNAGK